MPERPAPPALIPFGDACRLVVQYLKDEVPLAFWSVTKHDAERQTYLYVQDDAYGKTSGDSHAWSDSFCQFMVTGVGPQIAPHAMAVPEYAGAGVARVLPIGAYVGVPIRGSDGSLFGTLCGLDPDVQPDDLLESAPLLRLFATLLGQILHSERMGAYAAEREAELRWNASHDQLTGLPNRAVFLSRIEQLLKRLEPEALSAWVLVADIDDFKAVNDTLGHGSGDDLLVMVTRRLRAALRPDDLLARLSGDEFAVLIEAGSPTTVAGDIIDALRAPFVIGSETTTVFASVGVAEISADCVPELDVDTVLARADIAMYAAKRRGKSRFALFEEGMTMPGARTVHLREPLRRALASGAVEAHYQPIVELETGRRIAFESLARWRHDGHDISPEVFVPLAVRSGLISDLTDHMLHVVCRQIARWSEQGADDGQWVSVNVSPHCLADPRLPGRVADALHRYEVRPDQLVLEITEDALLHDLQTALTVADELRSLGVILSLDDFGTGYSSLRHLQQIPLQSLKIDRAFAEDIDTNLGTQQFMEALLVMGGSLGLRVIVEGVERQEQADVLRRLGCTHAQGYLFGRPAPPAAVCPGHGGR